jgi:exonuclease SbcD
MIAGNHDHPRRFDALAPILRPLRFHVCGQPAHADAGGVVEVPSRDGKERAIVASLPWVQEREAVPYVQLNQEIGGAYSQYAAQLRLAMNSLGRAFNPGAVNILMAHLLVDGAAVGPGGGERELHMAMGIYGVQPQMIPPDAQYVALGHVHKPQSVRDSPPAWYPGSILQLDFGEQRQQKSVNLIEAHPGLPVEVVQLPITAGRPLVDVGSPMHGVALSDLHLHAERSGDAWLRVFVDVDGPIADLPAVVRETLPNAVHVERLKTRPEERPAPAVSGLGPSDMFVEFYRSERGRGREPSQATMDLFRNLLEEESRETAEA